MHKFKSKVSIYILFSVALLPLGSMAQQPRKQMQTVLNECDNGQSFDVYVDCVKSTYRSQGTLPDAPISRAFLAQLDVLNESYKNGQLSQAQSKALAYDAFLKTIYADNQNSAAAQNRSTNAALNFYLNQQQQNQQQLMQIQPPVMRAPLQTQCYKNGSFVNCTTQ